MIEWRGDEGVSGSVELLVGIGLLLFPLVMLVAAIPTWIEAKAMGELAAQEAARAFAVAATASEGESAGTEIARRIAANYGFDGEVDVSFSGVLDWGETVSATVTVPVPALAVPGIGTFVGATVSFSHAERVDDFRSFPP